MSKLGPMTMVDMTTAGVIPEFTLADRLRKAREFAGLEQAELAKLTQLSRQTISSAENSHTRPSRASLLLWAMATGTDLNWLERGAGDEPAARWWTP